MSDAVSLLIDPARMPGARAWVDAIARHGFDLQLDAGFNPREHSGTVTCVYRGRPAGFEYGCAMLAGGNKVRVTLAARNLTEFVASSVAGGVLCAMTGGVLRDPDSGELVESRDALAWASQQETRTEARRDAGARVPGSTGDPTWRTVCVNLAVAYAIAIIFTTYRSPPSDLGVLILGPLLLVTIAGIFGLATMGVVRLRKDLERRYPPRLVWLVSTWMALMLSLVDPFLPTPPTPVELVPANELRRGVLDH